MSENTIDEAWSALKTALDDMPPGPAKDLVTTHFAFAQQVWGKNKPSAAAARAEERLFAKRPEAAVPVAGEPQPLNAPMPGPHEVGLHQDLPETADIPVAVPGPEPSPFEPVAASAAGPAHAPGGPRVEPYAAG